MEPKDYVINKLAIEKAQLEVTLYETMWLLEQANLRIKELETKGSDEHGRCQDCESNG